MSLETRQSIYFILMILFMSLGFSAISIELDSSVNWLVKLLVRFAGISLLLAGYKTYALKFKKKGG